MITNIISLIINFTTAFSTSITAYKESKQNSIKANNYMKKTYVIFKLYIDKYKDQYKVLQDIFRIENQYKNLCEINKINDLEMIAYVECMMRSCQNCIDEFPSKVEIGLKNQEYDNLVKLFGYLKNFFMITNQIKDKARIDKLNDNHITIMSYKESIIEEIPYSLRNKCGGVNVDFTHFLENFDNMIVSMWENIDNNLLN